jgi:hypothetical protein
VTDRLRIDCTAEPDPPLEDRFELRGTVTAPAAVHAVRSGAGRQADLGTATRVGDGLWRRPLAVVSYLTDPGFPQVPLVIDTAAGAGEVVVTCRSPDPAPFRPVLSSGLTFPRRVCIVASGPSAAATHLAIPPDFHVIALNKAVLLPGLRVDAWMMNQLTSDSLPYYAAASRAFPTGPRIFRLATAVAARAEHVGRGDCHWFLARQAPEEQLDADRDRPAGTCIRSGGTVTGCALQLAFALGANDILLCGVDMHGDRYFDGSRNDRDPKAGTWKHVRTLDRLIGQLRRDHGVTVRALGETALNVPRWRPDA